MRRFSVSSCHSLQVSLQVQGIGFTGRGTTRAEDAKETPTQSHISPNILVYEDDSTPMPSFFVGALRPTVGNTVG